MDPQLKGAISERIGRYGNDIVDYINIFFRLIIGCIIIYIILSSFKAHGDADDSHVLYFNLILFTSIYMILMYIQKLIYINILINIKFYYI